MECHSTHSPSDSSSPFKMRGRHRALIQKSARLEVQTVDAEEAIKRSPSNCARGHGPAIGTVLVAIGTVGTDLAIDIVVIDLSKGRVVAGGVIIDGRCSVGACTVSFFLLMKGIAPGPQQANNTQQISNIRSNHAHHGQPPPSVVVAVVVV